MRRALLVVGGLLGAVLAAAAIALGEAHWEIRTMRPPLPEPAAVAALAGRAGGPVRIGFLDTATQAGGPGGTLAHPAFVLEWPDGRLLLVDAGMRREAARAFGRPLELLLGAEPIEAHGSVAEQLGPAAARVAGVAFTHLHPDHTDGLLALCAAREETLPVFRTREQAERGNYTTRSGRAHVEAAGCARPERLGAGRLEAIPGFPGVAALAAGGHTPGSTVFAAHVRGTTWLLAGDVSNFRDALLADRAKPRLYSLLVTPEAPERLGALRRYLGALDARPDTEVVVSHDAAALAASALRPWRPRTPAPEL